MCIRDSIKIGQVIDLDFDVLGYIDPGITVNIIRDGKLFKRQRLSLPERITGIIRCKNPRCITSTEQELTQEFRLEMCIRDRYKALQASGMQLQNYGTVLATVANKDQEEAFPLIQRFYKLGFNIEATEGTAKFLRAHGIRTRVLRKISEGSEDIPDADVYKRQSLSSTTSPQLSCR